MRKNKLLLLLALLMTAVTGAWAQEQSETIATTAKIVEGTHFTIDNHGKYADSDGMNANGGITVTAKNGETITKVVISCTWDPGQVNNGNTSVSSGTKEITNGGGTITVTGVNASTFTFTCSNSGPQFGQFVVYYTAAPAGYTVSLKDGVKDADKWTISPNPAPEGSPVTIQYTGRLKVKGVKATSDAAPAGKTVDMSTLTADYEAQDGETLTGTLASNVKISIADGATVTLKDATINGGDDYSYKWAGLNCAGDATIILEGTNMVKGFYNEYPGIQVPMDKTLTIQGTGSLNARSNGYAAGIGGGYKIACGNITISGGTVEATGGDLAAGIGGGNSASCGNITINGGTITATGGKHGPGIGGGNSASCGNITIANTVTKVTATKGTDAPHSIGKGTNGTCGTVTIGGTKYWENNAAVNGGDTYLAQNPLIYDPTAAAKPAATVTTAPTGAEIVGVGKTTALVSGGAAEGGTLMYAVTTTNTKPTSTAGFSDAVPTAKDITASGTVYVWYYVKGDDTHSDSEIAGPVSVTLVEEITWDVTNISDLRVMGTFQSYAKEGVTLSANGEMNEARWRDKGEENGIYFEAMETGGYTFTAPTGKKFTKIEMTLTEPWGWDIANLGSGWAYNNSTVTWKGTAAASTVGLLTGANNFNGEPVKSIVFYLSE